MTVSFELRTSKGVPVCIYDSRKAAIAEAERLCATYPGCYVVSREPQPDIVRRVWSEARLRVAS